MGPQPWVSRWVMVGGIRTRYIEAGDGDPIVLVHGGGPGSSGRWGFENQMQELGRHYRVLAPDQLGFGETELRPGAGCTDQHRLEHLAGFIHALCLAPVHLVGNSMGGYLCARYVLDYFENVRRCVLLGSGTIAQAMGLKQHPMRWVYQGTLESLREGIQQTMLKPVPDEMAADRFRMASLPGAREAQMEIVGQMRRLREGDVQERQRFSLEQRLPRSRVPMIMLWGARDEFAPPGLAEQLRPLLPNIPIELVHDAGHQVQHDRPDVVNRRILEHFAS